MGCVCKYHGIHVARTFCGISLPIPPCVSCQPLHDEPAPKPGVYALIDFGNRCLSVSASGILMLDAAGATLAAFATVLSAAVFVAMLCLSSPLFCCLLF